MYGVIQKVRNSVGVGVWTIFVTNCYGKCKGWGVSGHFVSHVVAGVLQESYVTKRGYQLDRDKLLRGGGGAKIALFSVTYFLSDPYCISNLKFILTVLGGGGIVRPP